MSASNERWPVQLVPVLKERGVLLAEPEIIAKTGWTTDELLTALDQSQSVAHSYHWVTLSIGVNNQYRGRDAENFRMEFCLLLSVAIERARNNPRRVIVLSIPDWSVTPFARNRDTNKIAREIDLFNCIKREETLARNAHFVDITDISRERCADHPSQLASDGLHPAGCVYQRWAERVANIIIAESRTIK